MYEKVGSASPKEFELNFLPQGGLLVGTVYHPSALVFLYLNPVHFVVKFLTMFSVNILTELGIFPLFRSNFIIFPKSSTVENSPALPAFFPNAFAILLQD